MTGQDIGCTQIFNNNYFIMQIGLVEILKSMNCQDYDRSPAERGIIRKSEFDIFLSLSPQKIQNKFWVVVLVFKVTKGEKTLPCRVKQF